MSIVHIDRAPVTATDTEFVIALSIDPIGAAQYLTQSQRFRRKAGELAVDVERRGGRATVTLAGQMKGSRVEALKDVLFWLSVTEGKLLLVDLQCVTEIDDAGFDLIEEVSTPVFPGVAPMAEVVRECRTAERAA